MAFTGRMRGQLLAPGNRNRQGDIGDKRSLILWGLNTSRGSYQPPTISCKTDPVVTSSIGNDASRITRNDADLNSKPLRFCSSCLHNPLFVEWWILERHLFLAIENDLPSGFYTSPNRNMNLPPLPDLWSGLLGHVNGVLILFHQSANFLPFEGISGEPK